MNELNHIAFIMDGNGRWGKNKNRGRNFGHIKGVDTIKKIIKGSIKLKIPIISFYVFSTENWKRPKTEINFLFKLIENYFKIEIKSVIEQGIKLNIIGELNKLPKSARETLKRSVKLTENNKKIIVNLAINYGSQKEIFNTFKKIKKNFSFKNLQNSLYTKNMPFPEILIRTGGHQRLSNFMLWQLAYSELFFVKKLWPDFKSSDLRSIIEKYYKRKRNFGAI